MSAGPRGRNGIPERPSCKYDDDDDDDDEGYVLSGVVHDILNLSQQMAPAMGAFAVSITATCYFY